jgi:hypothetical protein
LDLRCSSNSLPVHWNGILRKSRSHLVVQNQPLLTGSDVVGRGHNENWSLDSMASELMQTSAASTTTFNYDALEVKVILHRMRRTGVKFWKIYDGKCAGNVILILDSEMENIVLNLSEHLVVI